MSAHKLFQKSATGDRCGAHVTERHVTRRRRPVRRGRAALPASWPWFVSRSIPATLLVRYSSPRSRSVRHSCGNTPNVCVLEFLVIISRHASEQREGAHANGRVGVACSVSLRRRHRRPSRCGRRRKPPSTASVSFPAFLVVVARRTPSPSGPVKCAARQRQHT